ncbi:galactose oxidase [Pluteus cervinus]|uniref:Galactose oxidase n=1 Tax=Pluteus cervinus TaxID=181527 RepID=A0ACD3AI29_9AGAR|nr:galactose oxidase [Pluteus cervinus]
MAKKKKDNAAKAAKKAKAVQKTEKKEKKKTSKSKDFEEDDNQNLEEILESMRKEWEDAHKVTEELVEGPPSRRANATLTPCPNGNHLWCIGGEFFSEDGRAYFYNDVFRYTPEKDEWRKFVSPTCPGPRSAHAVTATPASGGKLFLFGGEFSSLHQTTFHHYRDFWCFDISTHSWDRIDTKIRPSARSGHRMTMWKHYIVLFGGFYDPGITTRYLNDLWVFDTQEYKWRQIEFRETDTKPSPRSGFSFLPTPEGIVLHGGYCKEYAKGKRPVGVMLEDTWFLHLTLNTPPEGTSKPKTFEPLTVKWERRKRPSFAPSLRSGCTMALWSAKNTGILFGGVTDEDTGEETLESIFWNDLYGYQLPGKGKWVSLTLKKPKQKGGQKKKSKPVVQQFQPENEGSGEDDEDESPTIQSPVRAKPPPVPEVDEDEPIVPLPRYNTMLSVLRNTLYIYGGIFEKGSREYTLDDFYSIQLDKMDKFVCLKDSTVVIAENDESSSDDDDEEGDDDDDEDDEDEDLDEGEEAMAVDEESQLKSPIEEEEIIPVDNDIREKATAFMGVAKDATRSPEDVISTPLPGETLAMFYARSREYWAQKALGSSENRGKMLRRDGRVGMRFCSSGGMSPDLVQDCQALTNAGPSSALACLVPGIFLKFRKFPNRLLATARSQHLGKRSYENFPAPDPPELKTSKLNGSPPFHPKSQDLDIKI